MSDISHKSSKICLSGLTLPSLLVAGLFSLSSCQTATYGPVASDKATPVPERTANSKDSDQELKSIQKQLEGPGITIETEEIRGKR